MIFFIEKNTIKKVYKMTFLKKFSFICIKLTLNIYKKNHYIPVTKFVYSFQFFPKYNVQIQ